MFKSIDSISSTFSRNQLNQGGIFQAFRIKQTHKNLSQSIQQSYYLHVNFFKLLQSQNQDLIKTDLSIAYKNQENSAQLAKIFHMLGNESNRSILISKSVQSLVPLLVLIKKKVQQKLNNMAEQQQDQYEAILIQNNTVSQSLKSQYKILEEFTKEKLFYLDILSVFFRENTRYVRFCKSRNKLITPDAITFLFGFSEDKFWKLCRVFNCLKQNITYQISKQIEDLVILYQIMALRNRIGRLVRKCTKTELKQEAAPMNYQKNFIISSQSNIFKYNFCQLAFSTYQRQIQSFSLVHRCRILRGLIKANEQGCQEKLKTDVLFIKIKYAVNFNSISRVLEIISKKQWISIQKMIEPQKQQEMGQLQRILPFIFLKDYTFEKAFSRFKLSQTYDLTNIQVLSMARSQIIKSFTKVAFHQTKEFSIILSKMLKIEDNHEKEFIIINRIAFSYQNLMNIPSIIKGRAMISKQDLTSNLILITNCKRIKSFCIVRDLMSDQKYISIVKKMMASIKLSRPFIVIFNEKNVSNILQWRQYYRFQTYCIHQYRTKMYVTDVQSYSNINIFLLFLIKAKLKAKTSFLTKYNFFELIEAQIYSTMLKLRKINYKELIK